jgi:hypothetical protein
MFGRKGDETKDEQGELEQWRQLLQSESERVAALPLVDLAAEVMVKGFGPGSRGTDDDAISLGQSNANAGPTADGISYRFVPDWQSRSPSPTSEDWELRTRIAKLVAEGLQELEHASLVRCQMHTSMGYLDWAATRRGRAALDRDEVKSILRAASD